MKNTGDALVPGTRLEQFVIERFLGLGGLGVTYLARDESLGVWRALRTLTKINLSSLAVCGLFGFYAAQRGTGGHDCRQVRGGVAGIG